jgi:peptidoglycan/xylan/chitin deacetylase (PgdA/CDA1 family)/folate-dependent phosphoribosylglycinamide formyltransferase PurN
MGNPADVMDGKGVLRVAFLVGRDDGSTRRSIEAICGLGGVRVAAILVDTGVTNWRRRIRNLRRNVRTNGWTYPVQRIKTSLCSATSAAVRRAGVSREEVRAVLKQAFPNRCFSMDDIRAKYGIEVREAGSLNDPEAAGVLRELKVDLGIVLGTRVLKASTFGVPRLGSINLHKGKVPEYRGMPPGFWELYDGAPSAGVTVHFVDAQLDTGAVLAESSVPIQRGDTPDTLLEKLHEEGAKVLVEAVSMIRDGTANPRAQEKLSIKPRTKPRKEEIASLRRKLPHWRNQDASVAAIARNLYLLAVYYSGVYHLAKLYHRFSRSRAAIYLHHRVNEYSKDVLTVDVETFTSQLLAIRKHYRFTSTAVLVDSVRNGSPLIPTTVAIHFDDCYRDVLTNGAPILRALGIPACAFVNSGYVDTERTFPHDVMDSPFPHPLFRSCDLQEWVNLGFEIGAHTVNHVDLGTCPDELARVEIGECGKALESIIGKPVQFFSFPFGREDNITASAKQSVENAGYSALFSAHGGFVEIGTDPYDIPRMGASYALAPVYCLLGIEGLTLGQVAGRLPWRGRVLSGRNAKSNPSTPLPENGELRSSSRTP